MTRMLVRIEFNETGSSMGPRIAKLLERIREHGSIRKAAASLGMGYRHSWSLIQGLQETFEGRIVATTTGGNAGGGTALTPLGAELLAAFRRIEVEAASFAEAEMRKFARRARNNRRAMSLEAGRYSSANS